MKPILCLLLVAVVGSLSAATSFTAAGVSADINISDQHTLAVSISGTFVATIVLERKVSGGYIPLETWTAGVTYKPPRLTGVWRLRCSDYTSGTATYTLTSVADNQVIYRKPDGTTAFSVDVDGVVTNSGGATSGGTIDNAVIGGVTPASGTFTTLFATSVSGPTIDNAIIGGTTPAAGTFTAVTDSGLTSGRVVTASTAGLLASTADLLYSARTLTIGDGTLSPLEKLDGAAGGSRDIGYYSAGSSRWFMRCNTTAESGANAGSDFQILARSDAGSSLFTALTLTRSTGALTLGAAGASHAISSTTDSTSPGSGALAIGGGLGVIKNIVAGQNLGVGTASTVTAAGATTLSTTTAAVQIFTGSTTQTLNLPAANEFGAGATPMLLIKNVSSGTVTVQRAGSDTINSTASNVTSFTLAQWAACILVSDGSATWSRF